MAVYNIVLWQLFLMDTVYIQVSAWKNSLRLIEKIENHVAVTPTGLNLL